jgi:hypothetical protein
VITPGQLAGITLEFSWEVVRGLECTGDTTAAAVALADRIGEAIEDFVREATPTNGQAGWSR